MSIPRNGGNWPGCGENCFPWLAVITVEDSTYLAQPYVVTTQFKKVPDASANWRPTPCSAR